MNDKTLIKNAALVNEDSVSEGDLLIDNGRISRIDRAITAEHGVEVIDAEGAWLLPGMIDDQVHFREPGLTHKGGIWSESRAAVAASARHDGVKGFRPPATRRIKVENETNESIDE